MPHFCSKTIVSKIDIFRYVIRDIQFWQIFSEKEAPREKWIGNNFIKKSCLLRKKLEIENTDIIEKTVVYESTFFV